MFAPDRVVEMFVFDDRARPEVIRATAEGQLREEPVGEAASEDVEVDDPSSGGGEEP
jgi:hypothetical protein